MNIIKNNFVKNQSLYFGFSMNFRSSTSVFLHFSCVIDYSLLSLPQKLAKILRLGKKETCFLVFAFDFPYLCGINVFIYVRKNIKTARS